jgi:isoquinoline 1-oxidoreductase beta subunit
MLGFHLPPAEAADTAKAPAPPEVNAWIVIQPDDKVIIRVARSEMGQGAFTALPMLVAEELNCDWANVKPEFVSPEENLKRNHAYGSMATVGSQAVRTSHEYLRKAGASAREMLIAAAAAQWKVPAGDCQAEKGVITHKASGRTLKYGAVATAASKLTPPTTVALKDPKTWTIAGSEVKRFDTRDKVLGKPIYAIDVRLPDMLHAAIAHAPVFGGKLKGYTEAAIADRPGVHSVVAFDNAVAVVGDTYWHASQALRALPVTWDDGPSGAVSSADIAKEIADGLTTSKDLAVGRNDGDVKGALAKAAKVIQAEYHVPYLSHAPMETMNCTARITGDTVEVWAPTQNAEGTLTTAAQAAGVAPANVVVHPIFSGGGFGRRGGNHDFVAEAVKLAKVTGKPVKLIWAREQDIQHDFYRPISSAKFAAGFDAQGNPVAWTTRISGHSILSSANPDALKKGPDLGFLICFTDNPYGIANISVDYAMRNTHVPVGYWRSVNHSQNGFFRECFVDEMAQVAGADPYEFRRKLLTKSPKQLAVLEKAAKAANWGGPLPAGVARGIAQVDAYGSYTASVVEVSMVNGEPKLHRVVTAIDPGYVVNPDGVRSQMEGAVVWAVTAALYGEITIRDGRVEQGNFNDYRMLRIKDMPKVEVVLAPSGGFWGGVGEPGAPTIAPAMVNAMFTLTGQRVRTLPILPRSLRSA